MNACIRSKRKNLNSGFQKINGNNPLWNKKMGGQLSILCHKSGLCTFGTQNVGSISYKAFADQRDCALCADETTLKPEKLTKSKGFV